MMASDRLSDPMRLLILTAAVQASRLGLVFPGVSLHPQARCVATLRDSPCRFRVSLEAVSWRCRWETDRGTGAMSHRAIWAESSAVDLLRG
jgi:hypothetical protein